MILYWKVWSSSNSHPQTVPSVAQGSCVHATSCSTARSPPAFGCKPSAPVLLPAQGWYWGAQLSALPDTALQAHLTSARCPSKYPFAVDYVITLKVHGVSGADASLRNWNTFCDSVIARNWDKSPSEVGQLLRVGRFLIHQYSVALKTVASRRCHFKRIYIWNFIKHILVLKSLVTYWGKKGRERERFSKGFGGAVSFLLSDISKCPGCLNTSQLQREGSEHRLQTELTTGRKFESFHVIFVHQRVVQTLQLSAGTCFNCQ